MCKQELKIYSFSLFIYLFYFTLLFFLLFLNIYYLTKKHLSFINTIELKFPDYANFRLLVSHLASDMFTNFQVH